MKLELTNEQRVNPAAVSRFFPGNERAVLLIHGFTGTPYDMVYLGTQLNSQGFTVSIPRLPGHGTSFADFRRTGKHFWLRRVVDEYLELERRFEQVYIAGLSMGGLLSIILSGMFKPEKVALAAPAVAVYNRLMPLTPFLGSVVSRYRQPYESNNDDPNIKLLEPEYWEWQQVWGAGQVYSLQRYARRMLPLITAPTLTIVSERDGVVPLKAADIIDRKIGSSHHRILRLESSPHVVTNDIQRELVAREVCSWFLAEEN
ncbi:alpha/beta hydrolase [Spirochaeta africana]|uniref:Esterase/lipase n=1 Tax=Spirochaeta africana (strain ATCC 700263 / DSM 8902 / Z-7692) TaxID=889378 RepID=H9UJ53_SPIAZ|nr:alpha/beta fold hydrolase [Spirochaeta africana]AFG37546.1 esterase/lipase [Spirochaeta africana DSM 8902]